MKDYKKELRSWVFEIIILTSLALLLSMFDFIGDFTAVCIVGFSYFVYSSYNLFYEFIDNNYCTEDVFISDCRRYYFNKIECKRIQRLFDERVLNPKEIRETVEGERKQFIKEQLKNRKGIRRFKSEGL
jgi:hypothetical protein